MRYYLKICEILIQLNLENVCDLFEASFMNIYKEK